jgi:hypothetical protein
MFRFLFLFLFVFIYCVDRTLAANPSLAPTRAPTRVPTRKPSVAPTRQPTKRPSWFPTSHPTIHPSAHPTVHPTAHPTSRSGVYLSKRPSAPPTLKPSRSPTASPTRRPTVFPTSHPTVHPTAHPTTRSFALLTKQPSRSPSWKPSLKPSFLPTTLPTFGPTVPPTVLPTALPSLSPTSVLSLIGDITLGNIPSAIELSEDEKNRLSDVVKLTLKDVLHIPTTYIQVTTSLISAVAKVSSDHLRSTEKYNNNKKKMNVQLEDHGSSSSHLSFHFIIAATEQVFIDALGSDYRGKQYIAQDLQSKIDKSNGVFFMEKFIDYLDSNVARYPSYDSIANADYEGVTMTGEGQLPPASNKDDETSSSSSSSLLLSTTVIIAISVGGAGGLIILGCLIGAYFHRQNGSVPAPAVATVLPAINLEDMNPKKMTEELVIQTDDDDRNVLFNDNDPPVPSAPPQEILEVSDVEDPRIIL